MVSRVIDKKAMNHWLQRTWMPVRSSMMPWAKMVEPPDRIILLKILQANVTAMNRPFAIVLFRCRRNMVTIPRCTPRKTAEGD